MSWRRAWRHRTFLAFTLQEVPGSPALAAGPVEIPVGTKVQSVPGPGEQPQTFETVAAVEARAEWNAIPVQTTFAWHPHFGDTQLWLAGVGSGLQPGDAILIVGQDRLDDTGSERWDIRLAERGDGGPGEPAHAAAAGPGRWAMSARIPSPRAPALRSMCSASAPACSATTRPIPG